jgi:hypothetical protein
MVDIDEAIVTNIIFHRLGLESGSSFINTSEYQFKGEEEEEVLNRIFLKPFTNNVTTYEFSHNVDLEMNVLFSIARNIKNDDNFVLKSRDIFQHIKDVSKHPNIKDGDLFVVKFDNIRFDNNYYAALGIYKVENKENFIETKREIDGEISMDFKKGIGAKKLDKACLILFGEEPFTVFVIDNTSKDTEYWLNDFINVSLRNDYVNNTSQFMNLTKSFITEKIPEEYEVNKADQIDFLNRSVDYFKSHDSFEKEEFEKEVFQESSVIESFRSFDKKYSSENEISIDPSFEISPQAVKKQARIFKSILKLDKNFHIYIHGNKELIEQGIDADGRKFYKIFYEEES